MERIVLLPSANDLQLPATPEPHHIPILENASYSSHQAFTRGIASARISSEIKPASWLFLSILSHCSFGSFEKSLNSGRKTLFIFNIRCYTVHSTDPLYVFGVLWRLHGVYAAFFRFNLLNRSVFNVYDAIKKMMNGGISNENDQEKSCNWTLYL